MPIPEHPAQLAVDDVDLPRIRRSCICYALAGVDVSQLTDVDIAFLCDETRLSADEVHEGIVSARETDDVPGDSTVIKN